MPISDILTLQNILPRLRAASKDALLRDLAERVAIPAGLSAEAVRHALLRREELGSTGVGSGIAIPHARIAGLAQPIALFAKLDRPLDYGAIDAKPVDLVFLLLMPETEGTNLQMLALAARALRDRDRAQALRKATEPPAILDLLCAGTQKD